MKFKVVVNKNGMYAVKYRFWFWPLWSFDYEYTSPLGCEKIIEHKTLEEAKERIKYLKAKRMLQKNSESWSDV